MKAIDDVSKEVGITSVKAAKELCKGQFGRLPRPGFEICIQKGTVYRSSPLAKKAPHEYCTYLSHEGNWFRVWSWVSVSPVRNG